MILRNPTRYGLHKDIENLRKQGYEEVKTTYYHDIQMWEVEMLPTVPGFYLDDPFAKGNELYEC